MISRWPRAWFAENSSIARISSGASLTSVLRELDHLLQFCEIFGVAERQEKEGLLPRCFERRVVTVLDPFESKGESLWILRERLSGPAMDRA